MTLSRSLLVRLCCVVAFAAKLAACTSTQMVATKGTASLSPSEMANVIPPGCIALLTTSPNGDALVQAVATGVEGKGCADSSGFPPGSTTRDGDWLVYFETSSGVTVRYRLIESRGDCLRLVEVRQNFGGSLTTSELLLVESGIQSIPGENSRPVLVVLRRFAAHSSTDAAEYMRLLAKNRICKT